MTDKLACIILDALDPFNMRSLDMEYLYDIYESDEYSSGLMGVSGLAHTPISNSLMWGDYKNEDKIWVENHPYRWTGGVDGFDPILQNEDEDISLWHRDDIETNFIWDVLNYRGLEACALGIPICLPPYSYNADLRLINSWFPHTPEALREHTRKKPRFIEHHAFKGYDFIACSIKVPDQWLHAQGSEIIDRSFVEDEVPVLEKRMKRVINILESEGYDWLIFGDHGTPCGGRTANFKSKKLLARHKKEAAIMGTTDALPQYTEDMYQFILDYFGVDDVDELLGWKESPPIEEAREHAPIETIMESTLYNS